MSDRLDWREVMRGLECHASLHANDAPYQDPVELKRFLRYWCKKARRVLAENPPTPSDNPSPPL